MGAGIVFENVRNIAGEDLGDIVVKSSSLNNIEIEKELIPNIIDEIPILSVAGLFANGYFVIENAEELRFKESDRIKSLCHNYKLLGLNVDEFEDGFRISGEIKNENVIFESFGDHRIAMAFAVLSSLLFEETEIKDFECVSISNPEFLKQLRSITE
jgi:3-phosphoshikimate 1-carboxyvinyltransferase